MFSNPRNHVNLKIVDFQINSLNICQPRVVDPSHCHSIEQNRRKNPFQTHNCRGDFGLCSEQAAARHEQPSMKGPKYSKIRWNIKMRKCCFLLVPHGQLWYDTPSHTLATACGCRAGGLVLRPHIFHLSTWTPQGTGAVCWLFSLSCLTKKWQFLLKQWARSTCAQFRRETGLSQWQRRYSPSYCPKRKVLNPWYDVICLRSYQKLAVNHNLPHKFYGIK